MKIRVRRRASAQWDGAVDSGAGRIRVASGLLDAPYSLASRVGDEPQTNPEELIGAGHAGCFAMSLANLLDEHGYDEINVTANATVQLEEQESGFSITRIELEALGSANGLDEETFADLAAAAKATCPVSRALAGTQIVLTTKLAALEG